MEQTGNRSTQDGFALEDRVVLVTGASRGVGAAIAVAAAAEGAHVACVARSTDAAPKRVPGTLDETVGTITDAGGSAIAIPADLSDPDDIEAMVATTVQHFGRLDVLVNNAAVTFVGDVDIDLKKHDLIMAINVQAPLLAVRAALPHMREAGCGRIIGLSSQAALRPVPGLMSYGMSKLALERMTTDLARQLFPDRIAVNCFRIDIPVASEGTLANLGDVDLSDWEPTSVPAEGVLWMVRQPDAYSGYCESMWDLRHREGIMASRAEREHEKTPPLTFLQGLHDVDTENAFARGAETP
jgi:NAD(P)-dependent dehydrogenase (short-subunit alcohol dehydrogenase family)